MRNKRGLTLFELLLALCIVAVLFFGTSAFFISSLRTHMAVKNESRFQREAIFTFHDMEKYLGMGQIGAPLQAGPLGGATTRLSPEVSWGSTSPSDLQVGVSYVAGYDPSTGDPLTYGGGNIKVKEIWYVYQASTQKITRWICGKTAPEGYFAAGDAYNAANCDQTEISRGILRPYADLVDSDLDGMTNLTEAAQWLACLNGLNKTNCTDQGYKPLFTITDPKAVWIGFRTRTELPSAAEIVADPSRVKKMIFPKTIFLREEL